MGRTKKPCPGCGEVCEYRPAAEVCGGCKQLLEDGRKFRKKCHRRIGGWVRMPRVFHSLPHIRHGGDAQDEFQTAYFDLVVALSAEIPSNEWPAVELLDHIDHGYDSGREGVYLAPAELDRLRDLYQAVIDIAETAYNEGVERGQRIIEHLTEAAREIARVLEEKPESPVEDD